MTQVSDRFGKNWLSANARIKAHPAAALHILKRYPANEAAHAKRTAVCAASFNTPMWQEAIAAVSA